MNQKQLSETLAQFSGTDRYPCLCLKTVLTHGALSLAEQAEWFW